MSVLLLAVLSFLARLPGVFWGYDLFKGTFLSYSSDEFGYAMFADRYLQSGAFLRHDYVCGLMAQNYPLFVLLEKFIPVFTPAALIVIARAANVFYGVGTVLLIFHMSKDLFGSRSVALASGVSLALASLHVVHSHMATPAISGVFWTYACFFSCLRMEKNRNELRWWWIACFCAAAGIAVKFAFITLIPLFYVCRKKVWPRPAAFVGFFVLIGTFFVLNLCQRPMEFLPAMLRRLLPDNFGLREHARWFNPTMYGIMLVPAVGLPAVITSLMGAVDLEKNGFFNFTEARHRWRFFCLELPLIVYAVSICFMTASFNRHLLPLVPYVAVLSGWGALRLFDRVRSVGRPRFAMFILVFLFAYQLVSVGWTEWQHVVSRGAQVERWLGWHQQPGETVWFPSPEVRSIVSSRWPRSKLADRRSDAAYVVFNEGMTISLRRSPVTPLWAWSNRRQGYYWHLIDEPEFLQALLKDEEAGYSLAAYFPMREIIPEFILFKTFFGSYYWLAGDVWVFQRTRRS